MSQLLTVENQSTVIASPAALFNMVWSLAYQLKFHYGRSPWVAAGLAPAANAAILNRGGKVPVGAQHVILLDDSAEAGTLGWHSNEAGTKIPYAEVFCKTALQDGTQPSAVLSHEALEMLVNPGSSVQRSVTHAGQLWIVEVSDPVEGTDYDIGAPENRVCGVKVANFALPRWYGLASEGDMDFRKAVTAQFALLPGGYCSTAPQSEPENWSQTFGSERDRPPLWHVDPADKATKAAAAGESVSPVTILDPSEGSCPAVVH